MSAPVRFTEHIATGALDALMLWADTHYGVSENWLTLFLNGTALGKVSPVWQQHIRKDWQEGYAESSDGIFLNTENWLSMGDSLQHMAHIWHRTGRLHGWRDERFDLHDAGGNPLFALERAAFLPFGLLSRAVHLNGLVFSEGKWHFWIGRRSPHKAVDPDKLDNLVGGGISSGETPAASVCRESEEEAGLDGTLFPLIRPVSRLHSLRGVKRGVHNEILYVFDAVLPESFTPENQDGEVACFEKMDIPTLLDAMLSGDMMHDAQMVTLDAFKRYGLIPPVHPLYRWLDSLSLPLLPCSD